MVTTFCFCLPVPRTFAQRALWAAAILALAATDRRLRVPVPFPETPVIAGDWESLQAALGKVGIPEDQSNELHDTMGKEKTLGDGAKGWISRNAGKVLDVGVDVGAKVLTELLKGYLGG
jgi:hypothetical protein